MIAALGEVPAGCRQRLSAHYGSDAGGWLDRVPALLTEAADQWDLRLRGFHDAGHASVLALAETPHGAPVLMKASFDRERHRRETAALRHWEPTNGPVVRAQDDMRAVACLRLVGGAPGGGLRPAGDEQRVAEALGRLHTHPAPAAGFPTLEHHLRREIEPRMLRRARLLCSTLPQRCVDLGLNAVPAPTHREPVLLHADLYRENVPVEEDGNPVFLDPLPMLGDAAFDWAFFIVYFDLAGDPVSRLHAASTASGIGVCALEPWCLRLCLDGLLYYREVGDDRESLMVDVMTALAAQGRQR